MTRHDVAFWKGFGGSFWFWESEKTFHSFWIFFSDSLYQKLPPKPIQNTTVVCVFLMVVVPMLPQVEFGRNDHREYALQFLSQSYVLSEIPDRPSWWGNNVSKSTGTTFMDVLLAEFLSSNHFMLFSLVFKYYFPIRKACRDLFRRYLHTIFTCRTLVQLSPTPYHILAVMWLHWFILSTNSWTKIASINCL